jgi:hypothetical protein
MKLNRRITRESIRQRRRRNGLSRAPTRALSGSLGWDWRTPKYAGDLWDTALHGQRYVHHRITIGFFLLTTRRPHVTLHGFFGQFRRHFCSRWVCAVEPAIACQDFATYSEEDLLDGLGLTKRMLLSADAGHNDDNLAEK